MWFGCIGSTARSWLYQVCTPGVGPVGNADPDASSLVASAIFVHGPVTLAGLPLAEKMPWSTLGAPAPCAAGDCTIAYSLLPSAEYANVVRPMSAALMSPA